MRNVTEETLTKAVLDTISKDADPRFREIMTGLIKHLHEFALETNLSKEEWLSAIEFLYQTGKKNHAKPERVYPAIRYARPVFDGRHDFQPRQ